jgi:hypothetical protein
MYGTKYTHTSELNKVPILEILDSLGIKYFHKSWNIYGLYDEGKETDGRIVTTGDYNCVKDFSGKDRPSGKPYKFIKSYLHLTDFETFEWFRNNIFNSFD